MRNAMLLGLGLVTALGFVAPGASAQAVGRAFGQRGQVAISAERLLGVYVLDAELDQSGTTDAGPGAQANLSQKIEFKTTTFVLLGNDDAAGPAAIPRLAVDFFVIDGLSIGGSLLYWTDSAESDTTGTFTPAGGTPITADRTHVERDRNVFGFNPRVGYAYMFSPTIGIWPRGGISYVSSKEEVTTQDIDAQDGSIDQEDSETTTSAVSLTLEGLLVLSPFEHVAFGVGPFFEIAFAGDAETEINPGNTRLEGDLDATSFGITSSLIAWF